LLDEADAKKIFNYFYPGQLDEAAGTSMYNMVEDYSTYWT